MKRMILALCVFAMFGAVFPPDKAAGETLKNCWIVGEYPAAESLELLHQALDMQRRDDREGLMGLRSSGKILISHAAKISAAICDPDPAFCKVTIFGKAMWTPREALQCN